MVKVESDKANRLLTIRFSRDVTPEEIKKSQSRLEARLDELSAGFRVLTDLTGLESMDPACLPFIRSNMDLCNKRGATKVVRVIPDPRKDIGLNILSLFHYRRGIPIVTCNTVEEAREILNH